MPELDTDRQRQAAEYARERRWLGVVNFVLTLGLLSVLLFTGISRVVVDSLPAQPVLAAALYLVIIMLAYDLITLPLSFIGGFTLPRRYGLSRQASYGWFGDHAKSLTMGVAFGAVVIIALYFLFKQSPDWWWLIAWGSMLAVSLAMTALAPVLLVPLFYKMHPLEGGELKERLLAIAARVGVKIGGIYIIEFSAKTNLANAAVMGLGTTKRIVISDTLIDTYTPEEIDVVMAHELAHQRHGDVWRLFGFQAVVLLGVFWIASCLFRLLVQAQVYVNLIDPAALPLLLFCFGIAGAPGLPVLSWFSRKLEAGADAFALGLTGKPDVFISAMTKLTDQSLGEARPSGFLERLGQDHPSYTDRVEMATKFGDGQLPIKND